MSLSENLKMFLAPRKCVSCRQILPHEEMSEAMCRKCLLEYYRAKTENCPECNKAAFECTCQPKLLSKSGSLCLRKTFFYHSNKSRDAQNRLVYYLKRHNTKRVACFAAKELLSVLSKEIAQLSIVNICEECVIANVPRGRKTYIKYGYDQAAEIAKMLSLQSGIPYSVIFKRRYGDGEQKLLGAKQRRDNVKNMIYASSDAEQTVKGKYVILLDDVVTTGASMAACISSLRKTEMKGVICCALAADLKNKKQR